MERLWTKTFILMTLGMLFLFTGFYLLLPTLPLFIKQIGGNDSQVGLTVGAFMLSAVIFRPIIGGLLDRFGRRLFMVWGLVLFIVSMYLYNWVGGIAVLICLRLLHGVSWAGSTTAMITAITDIIPPARRTEGMGWFGMGMILAMAVGPLLGIWITQNLSYYALFLIAVSLSTVALFLTVGVKLPFQPQTSSRKIQLFERSVLPITASVFFLYMAYGGITTFVPLFADSIRVNSGLFFFVYAATVALSRPITGKLSDRYGESNVIMPALLCIIIALLVLSVSSGLLGMLASAVLFGVGLGSAQPALQAATIRLARPDRKGVANASLLTATDLGIGMGAIVLGWVSQHVSYHVLFVVSSVSVVVSLIFFAVFVKRLLIQKKQQPLQTSL